MATKVFDDERPTRREFVRDLVVVGAGVGGVILGALIQRAQDDSNARQLAKLQSQMATLQQRQSGVEQNVAVQLQDQANVNNIVVNRLVQLGKGK